MFHLSDTRHRRIQQIYMLAAALHSVCHGGHSLWDNSSISVWSPASGPVDSGQMLEDLTINYVEIMALDCCQ